MDKLDTRDVFIFTKQRKNGSDGNGEFIRFEFLGTGEMKVKIEKFEGLELSEFETWSVEHFFQGWL